MIAFGATGKPNLSVKYFVNNKKESLGKFLKSYPLAWMNQKKCIYMFFGINSRGGRGNNQHNMKDSEQRWGSMDCAGAAAQLHCPDLLVVTPRSTNNCN